MSEKEPKDSEAVERKTRKSFRDPAFVELYANASQGAFSPWDIQIIFGKVDDLEGEPAVRELVKLYLSPHHAKAVLKVFEGAVRGFEEKFGDITLSEEQQPGPNKAKQQPKAKQGA